ncbi:MAG: hypothetical protein FWG89_10655, partial [Treponema sp.]|nr:hypothetical protein [Treponema sp.]
RRGIPLLHVVDTRHCAFSCPQESILSIMVGRQADTMVGVGYPIFSLSQKSCPAYPPLSPRKTCRALRLVTYRRRQAGGMSKYAGEFAFGVSQPLK